MKVSLVSDSINQFGRRQLNYVAEYPDGLGNRACQDPQVQVNCRDDKAHTRQSKLKMFLSVKQTKE